MTNLTERQTLAVLVDNEAGVLSQISRLFSRKGYNIESLAVGATEDPKVSRITIEVYADEERITLLVNQLRKLFPVHSIKRLPPSNSIRRELVLIKVRTVDNAARSEILQIPPMYSALKVNGQKLYDLARKGREVERQPRPITIHELELLEFTGNEARLRVRCSKGTYIRTLCKDIGEALGCGGCMAALRRVEAGEYTLEGSIPLRQLLDISEAGEDVEHLLRPVDTMFASHEKLSLNEKQARLVKNGNAFSADCADGTYRVYAPDGEFLALCKAEGGKVSTIKSFFEV